MPPPGVIKGLDPRFFRPCILPLLTRWNYGTRVTLNNGVEASDRLAHEMTVSLSAFDDTGRHLGTTGEVLRLAPGEVRKVDATEIAAQVPGVEGRNDVLCIFHVVPQELAGQA